MQISPFLSNKIRVACIFLILISAYAEIQKDPEENYSILVSPVSVMPGQTFRVLVVSEKPDIEAELRSNGPSGFLTRLNKRKGGGPPYWWSATFVAEEEGSHRLWLEQGASRLVEKTILIYEKKYVESLSSYIWKTENSWNREWENLYSAWIESLFLDVEEGRSWDSLHQVLRNADRNILYNHLLLNEDDALILDPDCADNPFFFRAYFAWKLGLPYGYHACGWGDVQKAPRCGPLFTNHDYRKKGQDNLKAFQSFVRTIKNTIHSRSARTAFSDNSTDFYPLPLQREHLRPGAVFADPYGHTLMIVRWISQTENKSGQMFAVDAQPDGTIGIRRFWEGQFLFSTDQVIGEPGFKAFRPLIKENGKPRLLTNKEIADSQDYGNFSLQQKNMSPQIFYDTMDSLINPHPLDPVKAFKELHEAVHERLQARAKAVANGERYMKETNFEVISMPSGSRIFQTSGPWENYSTPARDMRLLIALDVLTDFPAKVMRKQEAFSISGSKKPEELRAELIDFHWKWAEEITITYTRSSGQQQTLSLADILKRMEKLEMAYNPNDSVEIRWGADEESDEFTSSKRRAPAYQRQKMESYRKWFKDRIFPTR
jgi:hypothetical protein